ncbi:hypothetical protein [Methanosarcina sp. UBA5]|uniref:hypothetical protein n=1 Tax=Methanosarcina sp. UBA5 TaxID=1915593 RepID=UPI0025F1E578|nr:hypothetical protein [Methanosarcina sp. UBA5]
MNVYFGLTQWSDMLSVYVYLPGHDIDNVVLKANGITPKSAKQLNIEKVAENPKLGFPSIIKTKVNKLVEEKIAEFGSLIS